MTTKCQLSYTRPRPAVSYLLFDGMTVTLDEVSCLPRLLVEGWLLDNSCPLYKSKAVNVMVERWGLMWLTMSTM